MALEEEVKELNAGFEKITNAVNDNSEKVREATEVTVITVKDLALKLESMHNGMLELQTSIKEITGLLLNTQRNTEEIKVKLE